MGGNFGLDGALAEQNIGLGVGQNDGRDQQGHRQQNHAPIAAIEPQGDVAGGIYLLGVGKGIAQLQIGQFGRGGDAAVLQFDGRCQPTVQAKMDIGPVGLFGRWATAQAPNGPRQQAHGRQPQSHVTHLGVGEQRPPTRHGRHDHAHQQAPQHATGQPQEQRGRLPSAVPCPHIPHQLVKFGLIGHLSLVIRP